MTDPTTDPAERSDRLLMVPPHTTHAVLGGLATHMADAARGFAGMADAVRATGWSFTAWLTAQKRAPDRPGRAGRRAARRAAVGRAALGLAARADRHRAVTRIRRQAVVSANHLVPWMQGRGDGSFVIRIATTPQARRHAEQRHRRSREARRRYHARLRNRRSSR